MRASFRSVAQASLESPMSIHNELSSDIAVALLTGKDRDPQKLDDLKKVVLKVHSILQEASRERGPKRARAMSAGEKQRANQ
jgi:hypothetical protein